MRERAGSYLLALLVALTALSAPGNCQSANDSLDRAAFLDWAARHAIPLSADTTRLGRRAARSIVDRTRHARVVGLGESVHGVPELLALRHQLTRALIESGTVAAIAMETGAAESAPIDAWLQGAAVPDSIVERSLSYHFGQLPEIREILRWLRSHNARHTPAHRVHFYGLDLPADGGGSLQPALQPTLAYLDLVDPVYAHTCRRQLDPIARQLDAKGYEIVRRYASLPDSGRRALQQGIDALVDRMKRQKSRYVARSSSETFDTAEHLAEIASQTERALRIGWNAPENPRDEAMAANVRWVLRRERGRGLVIVWAHNLHVARVPIAGPLYGGRGVPSVMSMGGYLQSSLGATYVALGTAYHAEPFTTTEQEPAGADTLARSSMDETLERVGPPKFLLWLAPSRPEPDAERWLSAPRPMRAEGSYVTATAARAYDGLVFLHAISDSH